MTSACFRKICAALFVVLACAVLASAGTILTGWFYSDGPYGYSVSENAWLYFSHAQPTYSYVFATGQWVQEIDGWSYASLPYLYSTMYNSWLFVDIPPNSFFVYNFSTGTWTEQPASP